MNIDLLADATGQIHNSPYNYALNTPTILTDSDGNCPPGVDCFSVLLGAFNAAKKYYSAIGDGATNTFKAAGNAIKETVTSPVKTVKTAAANHFNGIKDGTIIVNTLKTVSTINPQAAMINDIATAAASDDPITAVGNAQGERLANQSMEVTALATGEIAGRGLSMFKKVEDVVSSVDSNTLSHVFGKSEHNLGGLLDEFGGSQIKTFDAVQEAANSALKNGDLTPNANGILPSGDAGNIITVAGQEVRLIGGKIIDGEVQISSFSQKGLN